MHSPTVHNLSYHKYEIKTYTGGKFLESRVSKVSAGQRVSCLFSIFKHFSCGVLFRGGVAFSPLGHWESATNKINEF